MRTALRYLLTSVIGLAVGVGAAVQSVRAGALGSNVQIGPWSTGLDFGTVEASAKTRAVVALRGLLALPAKEARYYTAAVDDAGQPLDGRCRYRVAGGVIPGRWWSLTLYDREGYLVKNGANRFSVQSSDVARYTPGVAADDQSERARAMRAIFAAEQRWAIQVSPTPPPASAQASWLPTGGIERFELTLRIYLPADEGRSNPPRAMMPSITKEGC
jgi:hypothetical protein